VLCGPEGKVIIYRIAKVRIKLTALMNENLQKILTIVKESNAISEEDKSAIAKAIKNVDSELVITEFKLDRTEKVKRTTSILLEETIEELETKRADVEKVNSALTKSLEELKAAQAQLIQSEKMASLGELTAGIAHEIQNPLNFVNNFAEVSVDLLDELHEEMSDGNAKEVKAIADDLKQNLEKITDHGKRASGIVKGMLEHSRSSDGKKELTDINALADEYLRLAYHGLRAKDKSFNADFTTDLEESLPKINVMPQEIGRVMLNLINNAFHAVREKAKGSDDKYQPTVIVSSRVAEWPETSSSTEGKSEVAGEAGHVRISVKDNGSGIPQAVLDKIFQPFFTTKPSGEGTGLGLSLSYDIVKAHGGELKVETREGEGTEFIIVLPSNNLT
jgi:two-component system, NtrC family, sensor kinase